MNSLEPLNKRFGMAEEKVSEPEDRSVEIIQSEKQKKEN